MTTIDHNEQAAQDGDRPTAGTAVVPLVPTARRRATDFHMARPDPTFVTHLIATAQQLPQTRHLRRAAPSDALSAYTAHQHPAQRAGGQARHDI